MTSTYNRFKSSTIYGALNVVNDVSDNVLPSFSNTGTTSLYNTNIIGTLTVSNPSNSGLIQINNSGNLVGYLYNVTSTGYLTLDCISSTANSNGISFVSGLNKLMSISQLGDLYCSTINNKSISFFDATSSIQTQLNALSSSQSTFLLSNINIWTKSNTFNAGITIPQSQVLTLAGNASNISANGTTITPLNLSYLSNGTQNINTAITTLQSHQTIVDVSLNLIQPQLDTDINFITNLNIATTGITYDGFITKFANRPSFNAGINIPQSQNIILAGSVSNIIANGTTITPLNLSYLSNGSQNINTAITTLQSHQTIVDTSLNLIQPQLDSHLSFITNLNIATSGITYDGFITNFGNKPSFNAGITIPQSQTLVLAGNVSNIIANGTIITPLSLSYLQGGTQNINNAITTLQSYKTIIDVSMNLIQPQLDSHLSFITNLNIATSGITYDGFITKFANRPSFNAGLNIPQSQNIILAGSVSNIIANGTTITPLNLSYLSNGTQNINTAITTLQSHQNIIDVSMNLLQNNGNNANITDLSGNSIPITYLTNPILTSNVQSQLDSHLSFITNLNIATSGITYDGFITNFGNRPSFNAGLTIPQNQNIILAGSSSYIIANGNIITPSSLSYLQGGTQNINTAITNLQTNLTGITYTTNSTNCNNTLILNSIVTGYSGLLQFSENSLVSGYIYTNTHENAMVFDLFSSTLNSNGFKFMNQTTKLLSISLLGDLSCNTINGYNTSYYDATSSIQTQLNTQLSFITFLNIATTGITYDGFITKFSTKPTFNVGLTIPQNQTIVLSGSQSNIMAQGSTITPLQLSYLQGGHQNINDALTNLQSHQTIVDASLNLLQNNTSNNGYITDLSGNSIPITYLTSPVLTSNVQNQLNSFQPLISSLTTLSSGATTVVSLNGLSAATLAFLSNITSNVQGQLNSFQPLITSSTILSAGATTVVSLNGISSTLIGYLTGLTGNIQSQFLYYQPKISSTSSINVSSINGISSAILGYLSGLNGDLQSQLDSKQSAISAITAISTGVLTATSLITGAITCVTLNGISAAIIAYLGGLTGNIQTQLDSKQPTIISTTALSSGATTVVSLNGISAATLAFLSGITSNVQTQITNLLTHQGILDASFNSISTNYQPIITSSSVISAGATTVVSLNGISSTILGFLSGLTSNIQTTLTSLVTNTTGLTYNGTILNFANKPTFSAGLTIPQSQVLTLAGSVSNIIANGTTITPLNLSYLSNGTQNIATAISNINTSIATINTNIATINTNDTNTQTSISNLLNSPNITTPNITAPFIYSPITLIDTAAPLIPLNLNNLGYTQVLSLNNTGANINSTNPFNVASVTSLPVGTYLISYNLIYYNTSSTTSAIITNMYAGLNSIGDSSVSQTLQTYNTFNSTVGEFITPHSFFSFGSKCDVLTNVSVSSIWALATSIIYTGTLNLNINSYCKITRIG